MSAQHTPCGHLPLTTCRLCEGPQTPPDWVAPVNTAQHTPGPKLTAFVLFRTLNSATADYEEHEVTQDVTDEVAAGANDADAFEEFTSRLYIKQVECRPDFVDVLAAGVRDDAAIAKATGSAA